MWTRKSAVCALDRPGHNGDTDGRAGTGTNGKCCIAGYTCNSSDECVEEDSRSSSSGRNGKGNPEKDAAGKAATSGGAGIALVAVVMAALM